MRKIFFYSICLLSLSCSLFAQSFQKVILRGKVTNPVSQEVILKFFPNPLLAKEASHKAPLTANGTFEVGLKASVLTPIILRHGKNQAEIMVEPNDSLVINFDGKNFQETVSFSGRGGANNNLLVHQRKQKFPAYGDKTKVKTLEAKAYKKYTEAIRQSKLVSLKKYPQKKQLSPTFAEQYKQTIIYEEAVHLLNYPRLHTTYNRSGKKNWEENEKYYHFLKHIPINVENMIPFSIYHNFLQGYMAYQVFKAKIKDNKDYDYDYFYVDMYELAKKHLTKEPLYLTLSKVFIDGSVHGKIDNIIVKYDELKANNPYPAYQQVIDAYNEKLGKVVRGKPLPDFTFESIEGKQVSLADFKGKVMYIDFWATWCGPCRSQFPHTKKVKKHFEGKEIEFVYISTDKDKKKWQSFLQQTPLSGTQLFAGSQARTLSQTFNIRGIPRYVLVDENGIIADSHAKRPSQEKLITDIEKLLQSKSN